MLLDCKELEIFVIVTIPCTVYVKYTFLCIAISTIIYYRTALVSAHFPYLVYSYETELDYVALAPNLSVTVAGSLPEKAFVNLSQAK